jgi:hypothetical protein
MARRAIIVVMLVVAGLAGWWALRAPAVERPAVATPPDPDLETPAGRARLDAVLALAKMPDDPWTFAQSIRAASAASGTDDRKARCGEDEVPVYGEPVADADGFVRAPAEVTRPGGVGYTGARRRIDAALRASGDPFDRSVADWLNVDDLRTPSGRVDALVQDALGSSDARSYALAVEVCTDLGNDAMPLSGLPAWWQSPSCGRLDTGEWARRDPGNAVPWLFALTFADRAGDPAGQREALRRMATSTRFDVGFGAGSAAVARVKLMSDADLAGQADLAVQAIGVNGSQPYGPLTQRCRDQAAGDRELAVLCDAISDVMFDRSDGLITRAIGGSLHKLATGDPSRLDQAHREQQERSSHWSPNTGFSPCGATRAMMQRFVRVGQVGEAAAAKEEMSKPVPP